jgi:hypothetical protein
MESHKTHVPNHQPDVVLTCWNGAPKPSFFRAYEQTYILSQSSHCTSWFVLSVIMIPHELGRTSPCHNQW